MKVITVLAIVLGLAALISAVPTANDDKETLIPEMLGDEEIDQFEKKDSTLDKSQKEETDDDQLTKDDTAADNEEEGQEKTDKETPSKEKKEEIPIAEEDKVTAAGHHSRHLLLPLYRYWNPRVRNHFYTTNVRVIRTVLPGHTGRYGYISEGIAGIIATKRINCYAIALYRYWNKHFVDHFYTTNFAEIGKGRHGWKLQGVAGYCFSHRIRHTRPLYRYWHPGIRDHFYTVNPKEIGVTRPGVKGKHGYISEGIVCYVYY